MIYRWLWISLLVVLHYTQLIATQTSCKTNELCIFERHCPFEDDASRDRIGQRTNIVCGLDRICCDMKLLATEKVTSSLTKTLYKSCGTNKECVPWDLCNSTDDDSESPMLRIDLRINDLDKKENNNTTNNFGCKPWEKCCEVGDESTESEFRYIGCGYRNTNGLYHDMKNNTNDEAGFGEFPWMVAIMGTSEQYICGGVLIHPKLVLTTAHSVSNYTTETLILRAGEWDLHTNEERLKHQNRRVEHIFRHEDFDDENLWNDIALLAVSEPFELMPHVQPICLPAQETEASKKRLKEANCVASGWGRKESYNESHTQSLLKRIDLPIVGTAQCNNIMRQTLLGKRFWLRPSFLCAGGELGKDTCRGDGGSPLSCTLPGNSSRFELTGLVAWGLACGQGGIPGVYVNVPHLRGWIDKKATELGLKIEIS